MLTIEPYADMLFQGFGVYRYDTYPESSVLAGQPRRALVEMFETKEDAVDAYPNAEIRGLTTKPQRTGDSLADLSGLPEAPPGWFDPGAAGERWDEDY